MLILGIESSCDETAAAVVEMSETARVIRSSVVASQVDVHALYGGVVPEIASRAHIEAVTGVVEQALRDAGVTMEQIDAVGVTNAPGLIGSLLVGVSFAKGLALAYDKPLVSVNHIKGHAAAAYLSNPELQPPFVSLVVSGGHTHMVLVKGYTEFEVLGRAVDDAAGEAFDKVARTLGLPYPGGPEISKLAKGGDPGRYALPTPHTSGEFDVSFSGLKTAVLNLINNSTMKGETIVREDLAAAFEQRVTDILSDRILHAAKEFGLNAGLCGGVSINGELQRKCREKLSREGIELYLPQRSLCGDNGAMIASAGYYEYLAGNTGSIRQNAFATMDISTLIG